MRFLACSQSSLLCPSGSQIWPFSGWTAFFGGGGEESRITSDEEVDVAFCEMVALTVYSGGCVEIVDVVSEGLGVFAAGYLRLCG